MVEANENTAAVLSRRSYEVEKSREFAARGVSRQAGSDVEGRLDLPDEPVAIQAAPEPEAVAIVAAPAAPPMPPPDAGASYRKARLGVCACLVLALTLLWIMQRRGRNAR